jgi:methionine-rich copper-binding protein CopC
MKHISTLLVACLLGMLAGSPAFAHAFLNRAEPGVGMTVNSSPSELQLIFTEDLVAAFSGVRVATASGAPVATAKAVVGPANTLHVRLVHALRPGIYVVSWHVVSVDTHHTHGSYKFTIAP